MISPAVIEVDDIFPSFGDRLRCQFDVDREAMAATPLPTCSRVPSTTNLEEATSRRIRHFVRAKENDHGGNLIGLECLDHLFWHDAACHICTGVGCNGVNVDIVLGTFTSKGAREAEYAEFLSIDQSRYTSDSSHETYCCSIVSLPKVAVDATGAGSVDNPSVLLLQEVRPRSLCDFVRSS